MIGKCVKALAAGVSVAIGIPLRFSLRTLLALIFGNAVGVAAVLAWVPPPGSELAALLWIVLWSGPILTCVAAQEARRPRLDPTRK